MTEKRDGERVVDRACVGCGDVFTLTEREIWWYVDRFGEHGVPRRCEACRRYRKQHRQVEGAQ